MAGFGVVGVETFAEAGTDSLTFRGDIDSDVSTVLTANAAKGATELLVALDAAKDKIEPGDYIFLHSESTVEMVPVADANPVDLSGEPDKIKLGRALVNDFPSATTIVKTVETTSYDYTYGTQTLTKNGVATASGIASFGFRYFDQDGTELTGASLSGLSQEQRAAVRRIEISLATRSALSEGRTKSYSSSVDLRNMGNRGFSIDQCAPNPPTNLTMTETDTCGQFGLSWTPPTTNACNGGQLTDLGGYKVIYGEDGGDDFTPAYNISDDSLSQSVVIDARLAHDMTYRVRMVAYDQSFNESNDSTAITFTLTDTTRPEPPADFDASSDTGRVSLRWSASAAPDVSGYRIYRSTSAGFVAGADNLVADENVLDSGDLSWDDTNVLPCTTYYYRIAAVDCVGEGEASDAVFGDGPGGVADFPLPGITDTTPPENEPTPPAAAHPFGATGGDKRVQLQWTNPADADFDRVVIRWATGSAPTTITQGTELTSESGAPGETKSYAHENLTNGTTYYYSAWACDRCGSCGNRVTTSARASSSAPIVEITSPAEGTVVTNGQLVFQAKAYDPDETNLSSPPSLSADNGKGITNMIFHVTPDTETYQFPRSEIVKEYCGFGGDASPCAAGNVAQWCSGDYDLWV
ncbi:MAG: fibronectin type III domain-containing protein, partial [Deltaproteobacteria bacterium]|nr:fibronectin type III domain-containing protein [Deltaproteobacteria bacterium]